MRHPYLTRLAALALNAVILCVQASPPMAVQPQATAVAEPQLRIQTAGGPACGAPPIGSCRTCSVSCTAGQAALCKPGIAAGQSADAACVSPPECKCGPVGSR